MLPATPPIPPRAVRAFQLPKILNLSRSSCHKLIASGELKSFTVGRARFVAASDLDAWIDRQRAASGR